MATAKPLESFNASDWFAQNKERLVRAVGGQFNNGHVGISDRQRKQMQALIERELGMKFPKGAEIDKGGNMNENEGFGKQAKKWGPVVGGAALAAFGLPGVMPGLLSLGGSGAAASAGAASAIPGASAAPSLSSLLGAAPAGAASATGGGGMFGTLLGFGKDLLKNPKDLMSAAGSLFGAGSDAAASNRGTALDAALEQEKLRQQQMRDYYSASRDAFDTGMARAQEVRAGEGDAWRKLQQAAYVGNAPGGMSLNLAGPYSRSVAGPTGVERGAANDMRDEMVRRSQSLRSQYALPNNISEPNEPAPFTFDDKLLKPGLWETISGYAGAGMKALGGVPVNRGQVNG